MLALTFHLRGMARVNRIQNSESEYLILATFLQCLSMVLGKPVSRSDTPHFLISNKRRDTTWFLTCLSAEVLQFRKFFKVLFQNCVLFKIILVDKCCDKNSVTSGWTDTVYSCGMSFSQSTSSQWPQPNWEAETGKCRESHGYLVSVNGLCCWQVT